MQFSTAVAIPRPLRPVSLSDKNVFLGSCFAEHVGGRFADSRLAVLSNPLGVMYNPLSIVRLLTTREADPARDFVQYKDMWHTWLGDTSLSCLCADECRQTTNRALAKLHQALAHADNLFLTFGTSRYYIYQEAYEVVANCHRLPGAEFEEHDLSVSEIVDCLESALLPLFEQNPRLQVIVTVSPYRYLKYGLHESQLAKARLLLAAHELQERHADRVTYFPAYEIVMDELRDYRFYADDMLHPSPQAIDYVWQRFCETWTDDDVRTFLSRWEPLRRALSHKPLHPESPEFIAFSQRTREQLQQLQHDYPMLSLSCNSL